jgi:hypothetical protein
MAYVTTNYTPTQMWSNWVTTGTTSATGSYYGNQWYAWQSSSTSTTATYYTTVQWDRWNTVYEETAQQKEERRIRSEQYAEQERVRKEEYKEREARQIAAKAKAKDTFVEHLSPEQKEEFELHHSVTVIGSDGRRYLIHTNRGLAGNVEVFEEEQPILRLCAHPRDYVQGEQDPLPQHDHFFSQMLQIQHDAEEFCRVAIVHWRAA